MLYGGLSAALRPTPLTERSDNRSFFVSGLFGGLLSGMFGVSGPPLIFQFYRQPLTLVQIRCALIVLFTTTRPRVLYSACEGQLDRDIWLLAAIATPVVMRRWPPVRRRCRRRAASACVRRADGDRHRADRDVAAAAAASRLMSRGTRASNRPVPGDRFGLDASASNAVARVTDARRSIRRFRRALHVERRRKIDRQPVPVVRAKIEPTPNPSTSTRPADSARNDLLQMVVEVERIVRERRRAVHRLPSEITTRILRASGARAARTPIRPLRRPHLRGTDPPLNSAAMPVRACRQRVSASLNTRRFR